MIDDLFDLIRSMAWACRTFYQEHGWMKEAVDLYCRPAGRVAEALGMPASFFHLSESDVIMIIETRMDDVQRGTVKFSVMIHSADRGVAQLG